MTRRGKHEPDGYAEILAEAHERREKAIQEAWALAEATRLALADAPEASPAKRSPDFAPGTANGRDPGVPNDVDMPVLYAVVKQHENGRISMLKYVFHSHAAAINAAHNIERCQGNIKCGVLEFKP